MVREIEGSLLFIGAYRSNTDWAVQVAAHLAQTLTDGGAAVRKLHLEALRPQDTEEMVSSILGGQTSGIEELVAEVSADPEVFPIHKAVSPPIFTAPVPLTFSPDQLAWQYTPQR